MQRMFGITGLALAASFAIAVGVSASASGTGAPSRPFPAPPAEAKAPAGHIAVFAGGCFWGMEGVFEHVKGVRSVTSGYTGGSRDTANYETVSSERTNHAESIRIDYDPAVVSYGRLLEIYFAVAHDPTQVNGQYPDEGRSYRSAIFPQSAEQRDIAARYIAELDRDHVFAKPIATHLETGTFYPAEAYHQQFMRHNPNHPYIQRWDVERVQNLRTRFPQFYQ